MLFCFCSTSTIQVLLTKIKLQLCLLLFYKGIMFSALIISVSTKSCRSLLIIITGFYHFFFQFIFYSDTVIRVDLSCNSKWTIPVQCSHGRGYLSCSYSNRWIGNNKSSLVQCHWCKFWSCRKQ